VVKADSPQLSGRRPAEQVGPEGSGEWRRVHDGERLQDAWPLPSEAEALHRTYPALAKLNDPGTWARLQCVASRAIVKSVLDLAKQGIPAPLVHERDALYRLNAGTIARGRSLLSIWWVQRYHRCGI
jgi:hypothetical protein